MRRKNTNAKPIVIKFLSVVGIVVGSFIVLIVGAIAAYFYFVPRNVTDGPKKGGATMVEAAENETQQGNSGGNIFSMPLRTNVLVMGINENDNLADSIFVVCFNAETKKIDIISIPRDTYIVMSPKNLQALKDDGRRISGVAAQGIMKINASHSYPGKEKGTQVLKDEVETLLGIKIDYYVELNTAAFREIVDAIGGVEFDVPAGGLYYEDPIQDLVIAVPGGHQTLNGKLAEGVVRYRSGYARADLRRIEVQHEFMQALISQVLDRDNIISNAGPIISTLMAHVDTDFPLTAVPKYMVYLPDIKTENMHMQTLPGESQTLYHGEDKVAYYIKNDEELRVMVDEIFFGVAEEEEEEEEKEDERDMLTSEEVKALKIQILNGSGVNGLAAKFSDTLKAAGYNIINTGNYTGTQKKETRIMTGLNISGSEFEEYFKTTVTERDMALPRYDIIIIIGTDEN